VSTTQPLSGESSVLDTFFLISNGFLLISTEEGAKGKEQRAKGRKTPNPEYRIERREHRAIGYHL
jgi:hypothetical protein